MFDNVFQGTVDGIAGSVVIRQIKNNGGLFSQSSEIDSHRRIMDALFQGIGMGQHLIHQLIALSNCGSTLIERPVCETSQLP